MQNVILIYESEPNLQMMTKRFLEWDGHIVITAPESTELPNCIANHHPWLLVVSEVSFETDVRSYLAQQPKNITKVIVTKRDLPPGGGMHRLSNYRAFPVRLEKPVLPGELAYVVNRLRAEWERNREAL